MSGESIWNYWKCCQMTADASEGYIFMATETATRKKNAKKM